MKKIKYIAALLLCAGIANAQVITPTNVTYTGTAEEYAVDGFDDESNIIDSSGLSETPTLANLTTITHSGGGAEKWVTTDPGGWPSDFFASTTSNVVFEFELDATYTDIDTLVAWPYHGEGNNISMVDLYFSTDGGSTMDSTQTVAVAFVPGGELASLSALTPVTANHITMVVTDNHYNPVIPASGGDRAGLGEIRFAKGVVVEDPLPVITSFSADPASVTNGGTTTLSWATFNADTASLDQGIGPVPTSGSTQIVVTAETPYTLTATGVGSSTNQTITVTTFEPSDDLLIDPSLEGTGATGSNGSPGSGWFSYGGTTWHQDVQTPGGWWHIPGADGQYAVYQTSYSETDGGNLYQSVTLEAGVTYTLTAALGMADNSSAKADPKWAIQFRGEDINTVLAETTSNVVSRGSWIDVSVEYTPTVSGTYNVGIRNVGYVAGTGSEATTTMFWDNVRLTAGDVPPPTDPIENFMITGPVAISGGQGMVLTWGPTTDGQSYDVQSKSNLITQATWNTITNVTGTGASLSVTTAVDGAENFYQVETPTP